MVVTEWRDNYKTVYVWIRTMGSVMRLVKLMQKLQGGRISMAMAVDTAVNEAVKRRQKAVDKRK